MIDDRHGGPNASVGLDSRSAARPGAHFGGKLTIGRFFISMGTMRVNKERCISTLSRSWVAIATSSRRLLFYLAFLFILSLFLN